MSLVAMSWAFGFDLKPSSLKFLLVCLADNAATDDGTAYPSIKTLCLKTSQDRKTVIAGLDKLEEMGFLADTGHRVGATRQVKVYRLVGFDTGDRHYTYRVTDTETGEFYVGVRSCRGDPIADTSYFGSGTWPLQAVKQGKKLVKEVLCVYETRHEANAAEASLIVDSFPNERCQNRNSPKPGTVPKFRDKGPNLPMEESQNRYPESSLNRHVTVRGTRLPLDWDLSETRKAEAVKSGKDPAKEFEIFHDYWAAKPGRAGVRLDWDATWRNWCRRSFGKPVVADSGEWQIVRAAIKDSSLRATVLPVIRNKVGLIGGFNYLGSLKPYDLDQKRKEFEALR